MGLTNKMRVHLIWIICVLCVLQDHEEQEPEVAAAQVFITFSDMLGQLANYLEESNHA
jgi:hypothetical protein